jgi:hypothetical protein
MGQKVLQVLHLRVSWLHASREWDWLAFVKHGNCQRGVHLVVMADVLVGSSYVVMLSLITVFNADVARVWIVMIMFWLFWLNKIWNLCVIVEWLNVLKIHNGGIG